jgi:hypothetical protein
VGDIVTAAEMNANVRDAVGFLESPPVFFGYQNVSQSIANNTPVPVTFDSESVDTYNGHSTLSTTSRYTAQVAGWYDVVGTISYPLNATGVREVLLAVNGTALTPYRAELPAGAQPLVFQLAQMVFLNVYDYVETWALQTSGGALSLGVGSTASGMTVEWRHS